MNPNVDPYFTEGCGRCPLGGTPQCKVHHWEKELELLRRLVLECGLTETLKWSVPCYTYQDKNILILSAFKEYCSLSFFKGALLHDADGLLVQQTENVQAGRQLRFTSVGEIIAQEESIKAYIFEAIEVEKAGLEVTLKKTADFDVPIELQQKLDEDPAFKAAFEALTPGRQRGYLLQFAAPKQAQTRLARIEKYMPKIFAGLGYHDY